MSPSASSASSRVRRRPASTALRRSAGVARGVATSGVKAVLLPQAAEAVETGFLVGTQAIAERPEIVRQSGRVAQRGLLAGGPIGQGGQVALALGQRALEERGQARLFVGRQ